MNRLTEITSVYEAVVQFAEQIAPDVPTDKMYSDGGPIMVDYREIVARKHQLLREMLMGDEYDELETRRRQAQRVVKGKKVLDKDKPA